MVMVSTFDFLKLRLSADCNNKTATDARERSRAFRWSQSNRVIHVTSDSTQLPTPTNEQKLASNSTMAKTSRRDLEIALQVGRDRVRYT